MRVIVQERYCKRDRTVRVKAASAFKYAMQYHLSRCDMAEKQRVEISDILRCASASQDTEISLFMTYSMVTKF